MAVHWADVYAEKIIREKGEKDPYVCASGITPSGTVHIGNFREIISVELVVRALKELRRNVRFIYSWDDYDVFRKVPKNMEDKQTLEQYLKKPITLVPDTTGRWANYAEANEKDLEALLHQVGVDPVYRYQAEKYRNSEYAEGIRTALKERDTIRDILNKHRTQPLAEDWYPVSVFCTSCNKNTTRQLGWDGNYRLSYACDSCGNEETVDLRNTAAVKLPWRVDWPMRWEYEGVDFEPAGKDHHSEGGSFDTAREISREVYGYQAPVTFQYDFVRIKGRGGKISSSSGEVVGLSDVLEIYQPEIIRYLFAGTRPNSEFAISFDLDVLKIYEDYDRCERIYFGKETVSEKRREKERRIYELSQVGEVPAAMPYQLPFRHLCNLLQIHDGDVNGVLERISEIEAQQRPRLEQRAQCAWNWITTFAPESFRFSLRSPDAAPLELEKEEKQAVDETIGVLENFQLSDDESADEKRLGEALYSVPESAGLDGKSYFKLMYRVLIEKDRGPRLAGFLLTTGLERVLRILSVYR
ncbi:MAG: lysine--tRNA ligase [Spirochaetales bacterium]|nr:lysine--tRNA ligase [Spirochaetales bacterium]MCF7939176.1 lysine--tRNA ligase [Spirochaetales bacterium]